MLKKLTDGLSTLDTVKGRTEMEDRPEEKRLKIQKRD